MSDCYAMIWKPVDNSWGFFNLGILDTIKFNGYNIGNPVFSYCPDGMVRIYPREQMFAKQIEIDGERKSYTIGALKLSRTAEQIQSFIKKLIDCMDKEDARMDYRFNGENDYHIICPLKKDNEFYNYTENYHNCFYAVAKWFEWMGDGRMLNEFAPSFNAYNAYIPAAFKASNYFNTSSWQPTTYDGN